MDMYELRERLYSDLGYMSDVFRLPCGTYAVMIPFNIKIYPKTMTDIRSAFGKTHYVYKFRRCKNKYAIMLTEK